MCDERVFPCATLNSCRTTTVPVVGIKFRCASHRSRAFVDPPASITRTVRAGALFLDAISDCWSCSFFLSPFFCFFFCRQRGVGWPERHRGASALSFPTPTIPRTPLSSRLHHRHDVARNKRRAIRSRIPPRSLSTALSTRRITHPTRGKRIGPFEQRCSSFSLSLSLFSVFLRLF